MSPGVPLKCVYERLCLTPPPPAEGQSGVKLSLSAALNFPDFLSPVHPPRIHTQECPTCTENAQVTKEGVELEEKILQLLWGRNRHADDAQEKHLEQQIEAISHEQTKLEKVTDILFADNSLNTTDTETKVVLEVCATGQETRRVWTTLAAAALALKTDRKALVEHILDGRELGGYLYRLSAPKFTFRGGGT